MFEQWFRNPKAGIKPETLQNRPHETSTRQLNGSAALDDATFGKFGTLEMTVLNVSNDDFGGYASDGLPDDWQVQYFGENNPNAAPSADPDGDGQNNAYEYVVGTVPSNAASHFSLAS